MSAADTQLKGLPNLSVQLSVNYAFAVLTMFHELVEELAKDVMTKFEATPETLLHQETGEGAIHRLSVAIGCLIDLYVSCPSASLSLASRTSLTARVLDASALTEDLPHQLYTKDWVKLFGGLLSTFTLGAVPSAQIAELVSVGSRLPLTSGGRASMYHRCARGRQYGAASLE